MSSPLLRQVVLCLIIKLLFHCLYSSLKAMVAKPIGTSITWMVTCLLEFTVFILAVLGTAQMSIAMDTLLAPKRTSGAIWSHEVST